MMAIAGSTGAAAPGVIAAGALGLAWSWRWAGRALRRVRAGAVIGRVAPTGDAVIGRRPPGAAVRSTINRRRTEQRLMASLPVLCDTVAREAQTGSTVASALWSAGTSLGGVVGDEIDRLRRLVTRGTTFDAALHGWARSWNNADLDIVVSALRIANELGGDVASCCESCASLLRDRADVHDEIRSLTSQSRASATLLTGLPVVAAAGMGVIEPTTGAFLLRTPAGWACIGLAAALDALGWYWMTSMTRAVR